MRNYNPTIDRTQMKRAEAFVRLVLTKDFKQKASRETIRAVALKVLKAIPR